MNRFQNMAAQSNDARILAVLVLSAALASIASPAFAAADGDAGIDWFTMGMQLFGGLAIFLFGMEQMAESLRKVAGNRMKDILGKLTTNRFMGVLTGAFVTSVIQSSSITTVMLVGFVTAGLMSLSQAVGVIFGANIGTTVTAQIVAFKVTHYALLLVAAGFVLLFGGKSDRLKTYGVLIMGLGLIFFGMGIMSSAMKPLRSFEPFLELMRDVSTPAVGILIAAVFTGLVQSSSATTGVVIAMASQGLISLEGGIALIMGANIGTCVTAGLASMTFNVAGVAVMVWFIPYLAEFVRSISPAAQNLSGIDRLAAETPRQIANAHTIFNVLFSLIFLPLAGLVARFCEWVVPDKPVVEPIVIQPKYLDKELLSTPPLAIDRARREIGRLGGRVEGMLEAALSAVVAGDEEELQGLANMDTDVDILHGHIIKYLGKISVRELSGEDSASVMQLISSRRTSLGLATSGSRKVWWSVMPRKL
jgi:phosphate:Na+ symporter